MNKKIKSLLQYVFFLGLVIFLLWWSRKNITPDQWVEMKAALLSTNYWLLIPVSLALLLSHFSRAMRWRILMEPLGHQPSKTNTYLAVLIGYFANQFVPRLGEILKCTVLNRYEKVPADKLIGTIVAERAFDLICLLLVFAITFLSQLPIIGQYAGALIDKLVAGENAQQSQRNTWLLLAAVLVIVLVLWWLIKRYSNSTLVQKTRAVLTGIWQGITSIRNVKQKGWFFFHSFLIWFLYLASIRLGFMAMEATAGFGWLAAFSVLSLGSVGMIVTPGGIGAYPILVKETMSLYGLSDSLGNAFGWVLWLAQFLLVVLAGLAAFVLLPIVNRKPSK